MNRMSLILYLIWTLGYGSSAFARWSEPFAETIVQDDAVQVTRDGEGAARALVWAIHGGAMIAATILLGMCAKRLYREDYYGAFLTFLGALIAGASPYLSTAFSIG